ncbi:hypothetical protein A3D23_04515 [candidate division WOR-1 bacterium RIFCSPHIGHO2_02_FULL_53_26]|nr:MAG: hypothetical protein A3D23_04515 [candidate division WOR-1 bacterium RIFCSPHIGHO2_02_FULL_53_26]
MLGNSNYPAQYSVLLPSLIALAAVLVVGGLISIISFFVGAYWVSFTALPTLVFLIALILTVQTLPIVENFKGAKPLGQELAKVITDKDEVAAFETGNRPSVVLHSPKTVRFLAREAALNSFLLARRGYVFTTVEEYEKIKPRLPYGVKVFDKKGDLLVIYKP